MARADFPPAELAAIDQPADVTSDLRDLRERFHRLRARLTIDHQQVLSQRQRPFGAPGWPRSLNAQADDFREADSSLLSTLHYALCVTAIVQVAMPLRFVHCTVKVTSITLIGLNRRS